MRSGSRAALLGGFVVAVSLSACGGSKPPECPCQAAPAATHLDPPSSPELDALARERVDKALQVIKLRQAMYERGAISLEDFLRSYREAALAVRESRLAKAERITRLRTYADSAEKIRDLMRTRAQSGAVTPADVASSELAEVEARYWLKEAADSR